MKELKNILIKYPGLSIGLNSVGYVLLFYNNDEIAEFYSVYHIKENDVIEALNKYKQKQSRKNLINEL